MFVEVPEAVSVPTPVIDPLVPVSLSPLVKPSVNVTSIVVAGVPSPEASFPPINEPLLVKSPLMTRALPSLTLSTLKVPSVSVV